MFGIKQLTDFFDTIYSPTVLLYTKEYMTSFYSLIETFKEVNMGDELHKKMFDRVESFEKEYVYPILINEQKTLEIYKDIMHQIRLDLKSLYSTWNLGYSIKKFDASLSLSQQQKMFSSTILD